MKKIYNKDSLTAYVKKDELLNEELSSDDKIAYLDLKIAYLQYQRANNEVDKKEYLSKYLKLLKQRSSYEKISTYNIKNPINPISSHDSGRLSLFYDTADSIELGLKPAYNDRYDISDGYLEGAYIDFFDLNIKKDKDDNTKLDRFTLIKIKSLSPQDIIFKPISWGVDFGYEHFKDQSDYLKLKPEAGITLGNEKELIYTMFNSNIYYKESDQLYSIGSSIGLVSSRFENIKLGLQYGYNKYNKNLEGNQLEIFSTYKLDRNKALNVRYINDDLYKENKEKVKMGIYYYF